MTQTSAQSFFKITALTLMASAAAGVITGATAQAQSPACSSYNQAFKIYFESGSAVPKEFGIAVLDQAMENVADKPGCEIKQITMTGHQDTAGMTEFNEALSVAMVFAIAEEFVGRGVPMDRLTGEGKGETELAKKTYDDVREPLNRRVEVMIELGPV